MITDRMFITMSPLNLGCDVVALDVTMTGSLYTTIISPASYQALMRLPLLIVLFLVFSSRYGDSVSDFGFNSFFWLPYEILLFVNGR